MVTSQQSKTSDDHGYTAAPSAKVLPTWSSTVDIKELYYGTFKAVRDTRIPIQKNSITAFIGPSGCGKSTVLRCLNRMNDLVRGFRFQGHVHFHGKDIYHPSIDPVAVRRHIGMVFQQPNPVCDEHLSQRDFRPEAQRLQGQQGREGGTGPPRRGPLGRSQGQAAQERPGPLRRPAAAALHRPGHRHRTGGAA